MSEIMVTDNLLDRATTFFDYLDANPQTRREYKYRIKLFITHIESRGFDRNSFLEFKRYLADRDDFSVATKNKYLATARIFLKELYRLGVLPVEITVNVRSFTQSTKHKREGLNRDEIKKLIAKVNTLENDRYGTRIKAMLSLLIFQGLRQIELVRLDVKDIDLATRKARIQGKGMDDKEAVHLLPESVRAIRQYVKINKIADGALFKSLGNRRKHRLNTITIQREIGDLFELCGIEKTVHGLRHYYVTALLERFDVRDARKFSRHKNLEMLIVYDDEMDLSAKLPDLESCFSDFKIR